jgi:hypothetical protein
MKRSVGIAGAVLALLIVATAGAEEFFAHRYNVAISETRPGDREDQVMARFGEPSLREFPSKPFHRYADRPCLAPCAERLWWENPILRGGFEAWSVEMSAERKVLHSAHWVSP